MAARNVSSKQLAVQAGRPAGDAGSASAAYRFVPPPRAAANRWILVALLGLLVVRLGWTGFHSWTRETTVDRLEEAVYHVVRIDEAHQWLIERTVDGQRERARVRLLAVRWPEAAAVKADQAKRDTHGQRDQARRWAQEQWLGRLVHVELGKRQVDDDGVYLMVARWGEQTAQEELVRAGWLVPDPRPEDASSLVRRLEQAAAEARAAGRGCWAGQLVAQPAL